MIFVKKLSNATLLSSFLSLSLCNITGEECTLENPCGQPEEVDGGDNGISVSTVGIEDTVVDVVGVNDTVINN